MLQPGDWRAAWIAPARDEDTSKPQPAPMLRGTFAVDGKVKSVRAYVTSLGLYELEINGRRVGDQLFTPGWTSYRNRLQYQTYHVTGHLRRGENVVGATLGDGWYRGFLAWGDHRNHYGEQLALLCQLRITYADGREQVVGTDDPDRLVGMLVDISYRRTDQFVVGHDKSGRLSGDDFDGVQLLQLVGYWLSVHEAIQ